MNIETLNYIITPVLGAMAGYITNDYAINMLFKSYTPLNIGGIIPKTREEFIENVSNLVEQELITSDKIDEIINSEDFKQSFNTIIEDFFNKGILEVLGTDKNIGDVASFNADIDCFLEDKKEVFEEIFKKIYTSYIGKIDINNLADDNQIDLICNKLYDITIEKLFESDILSSTDVIEALYPSNSEITILLNSLMTYSKIDQLLEKLLEENFNNITSNISYDEEKIKSLIKVKLVEILDDLPALSAQADADFSRLIIRAFNAAEEKSSKSMVYSMGRSTVESKAENMKISEIIKSNVNEKNIELLSDIITKVLVDKINSLDYNDFDFSKLYRQICPHMQKYIINNYIENEKITYEIKKKAIDNLKPFFRNYLLENKDKHLNLAKDKLKKIIDDKKIDDLISVEAVSRITYDSIITAITNVKNLNICETIAKLSNIEGIYQGITNQLISLLSNNLTPVLKTFIRNLCLTNFNKLNDDELCDMAKSFMGNNLKPLMYFGGGLGLISGAGLAVLKSNPNLLTNVSIESIITYSFVGFITNAIAITMLFRPYNEISFLSKLPLAKHFSIGYIPKHKNIMAKSMSSSINNYLLSKESIKELFDIYENDLYFKLSDIVGKDEYKIITDFMKKHKYSIIDFTYEKLIELIKTDDLVENIIDKISNSSIHSFNKSDNELEDYLSSIIQPRLIEIVCNYMKSDNVSMKLTSICLDKAFDSKSIDIITDKIYENIDESVLLDKINIYIDRYDMSNMILDFALGYIDKADENLPKIIDRYYDEISNKAVSEITSSLNPFTKMAFNMAGGQTVIIEVLDELLYNQIPLYLADKKDIINEYSKNILSNKFRNIKLEAFDTKLSKIPVDIFEKNSIYDYINFINSNLIDSKEHISTSFNKMISKKLENVNLSDLIDINDMNQVVYDVIINTCSQKFKDLIDVNMMKSNINDIRDSLLNDYSFKSDFKDITSDTLEKIIDNNLSCLSNESKNQIASTTIRSGIISVKENSAILLNNIEFDKIAEEQLLDMDSRKIHTMFKSFAGKYFRRLKLYGVFGGIFGINAIGGLGLSVLYFCKNIISKFKRK